VRRRVQNLNSKSSDGNEQSKEKAMKNRYSDQLEDLVQSVLGSRGALPHPVRRGITEGNAVPPALADYVEKVVSGADQLTDDDIRTLSASGLSEDQIFEATVCAALGAGLARLRAGLTALETEGD
jgi:alkylhydroperoxidase family enzyme